MANLQAPLGLVKRACLAAARYIDVDHEQQPNFLLRPMASRDLVREAMVNSDLHPRRQQDPNGGDLPFQRKRLPGHRSVVDPPFRTPFPRLAFEDSLTAFDYACDGECLLHEGVMLPALILEVESFGAVTTAGVQGKGRQIVSVRVASADGGFIVSASTSGSHGPRLQPGHFVAWQAGRYDRQVADEAPVTRRRFGLFGLKDKRIGWVGLIVGMLKLEYADGGWVGDERFSAEDEAAR